jgi:hypothetical protein
LGLEEALRYGRDLDLDSLCTTDRATWRSSERRLGAVSWWSDGFAGLGRLAGSRGGVLGTVRLSGWTNVVVNRRD